MARDSYLLQLSFRIAQDRRHEFRQHADALLRETRPGGCLDRGLFLRMGEPGVFLWVERWSSADALTSHLVSSAHRTLLGAIRVLGQLDGEHVMTLEAREP